MFFVHIFQSGSPRIVSGFFIAMRIDRVKYTAHYDEFGVLKDQWIGLEAAIDDTEIPERQLDAIKAITESWYHKQNPGLQPPPMFNGTPLDHGPRVIEKKPEDRVVGLTPELITSCEDIGTLQSFCMLVDKSNRADLKEVYERRERELKEINKINNATN